MRKTISTGAKWESIVGYSRAVLVGNTLEISGTVATDDSGNVVGLDSPGEQTRFILEKIGKVLKQADYSFEDVVRTRIFVTDISRWEEVGVEHGKIFHAIRPATAMVEVSRLIAPEYLVEIEVTAVKD